MKNLLTYPGDSSLSTRCKGLQPHRNIHILDRESLSADVDSYEEKFHLASLELVARQSKSLNLSIWSRGRLVESNNNLERLAEKRRERTALTSFLRGESEKGSEESFC